MIIENEADGVISNYVPEGWDDPAHQILPW
jgi:hypothetical protein